MNKKNVRIMFTSVGRRVELVQEFASAAKLLKIDLEIYGADITDTAPALAFCDCSVMVPRIKDPGYVPELLRICEENCIDVLIPTIDTDLLILSKNKEKFESIDTAVLVSSEEKIAVCRDKRLTSAYFESVGLLAPMPVDDYRCYNSGFPAFVKPKDGSSSIFAYRVDDLRELENTARQVPDYIVQPFIEGEEYTVDVFCDFDGNPIYITPRIRLAVRAGEVLKTQIVQDETIIGEVRKLLDDYKPCGAITVQLIRQKTTQKDYYIEINPRFGGGAPLSMKAGANSAIALLKLVVGERLNYSPNAADDGAVFCRYDQSVRMK